MSITISLLLRLLNKRPTKIKIKVILEQDSRHKDYGLQVLFYHDGILLTD